MTKTFTKKLLSLILCLTLTTGLLGCSINSQPSNLASSTNTQEAFLKFTNELFATEVVSDRITLNYILADPTAYGITEYKNVYGITDMDEYTNDAMLIETIDTLKSFDREELSKEEQLTYDILYNDIISSLEYSDLYLYAKSLSPTIGINCQLPVILAEYDFRDSQDVYDYIELLNTTDEYFQFILELEKKKSKEGLFMMDDICNQIIDQCNTFTADPENNYLIEMFDTRIDAMDCFSPEEVSQLKEANRLAIMDHLIPAYNLLADGLTDLLGTGKYEGGLCNYPDGNAYYQYLIYSGTGSLRTVEEIEDLINSYMTDSYKQMGTALREEPNIFTMATEASFGFDDPYDILSDLQTRIEDYFPKLPETNYTIKYVHESLEENLSPAFYLTPAIDDYTNNTIYINNAESYAGQELYPTLAHEGFPGHLYQAVYTASKGLNPIRSLLNFPGYTEGWATYVELLSYEMGAIDETLGSFLSANQLITLCVYAKCDIGVNYHGWTKNEIKTYVSSIFGELEDEIIDEIYYTMVSEPANYLKYVLGCLEILELKKTISEKMGDKFSIVDFHDFLLTTGPAQFDIIGALAEEYFN